MNLLYVDRPLVINPALAKKIGLNEAIILQQLNYWLTRTDSGVNYDGVQWVYNTYSEWREQTPFFSERTIQRTILKLEEVGIIKSEMLRKSKGDRTKFYTINQSHEMLASPSRQDSITVTTDCLDHSDKMALSSRQNGTLSTETNSETTPDISKKETKKTTAAKRRTAEKPTEVSQEIWEDFLAQRKTKLTETALKLIINQAEKAGWHIQDALQEAIMRGWQSFKADWVNKPSYQKQNSTERTNRTKSLTEIIHGWED